MILGVYNVAKRKLICFVWPSDYRGFFQNEGLTYCAWRRARRAVAQLRARPALEGLASSLGGLKTCLLQSVFAGLKGFLWLRNLALASHAALPQTHPHSSLSSKTRL